MAKATKAPDLTDAAGRSIGVGLSYRSVMDLRGRWAGLTPVKRQVSAS